MDLHITLDGRGDRTDRIYRQLRDAILDGRLRAGERVPPSRELARRLSVARNTVAAAYDRLVGDGFLSGRAGAGTFVAYRPARPSPRRAPGGALRPAQHWTQLADEPDPTAPARFDLRAGHPDPALFPLATWRRLLGRTLAARADYGDPAGVPELRTAIARHAGLSRSVRAAPGDVLVTHGAQQALDLIARVLVEPGTVVAVEEPGYRPARRLFASHGARVVGVPVDAEGIVVAALPRTARLVYVTPSHQYPLGTAMSLHRRSALLAWAEETGAAVVEDDYDSEFRFSDRPLEPLQSLDRAGRVIYVGSFSKTLLPALRLGFLVAPATLRPALRAAKRITDWHGDPAAQLALAAFVEEGRLARHLRAVTRVYAARHELLTAAARGPLVEWFSLVPSSAGLHLTFRAAPGLPLDAVLARLRAAEVAVEPLAAFYAEPPARPDPGLVVGYGSIPTDLLPEAILRIAAACRNA
ncbi:PLP-dependent aminotransferase family protein [Dactylosporangium sp. AC04546]|uniref:MocR-like pyridoxine biosynthesis transcription factor PdxR n=1 Tax=Dactylosporangium sp. AC04546 TaxID=2862460 RepID=UPI001EDCCEBC|nr:PLP-dependent aminotransferase family protein [Dactylosporangium sp. AC04546]WVK82056.1 PLP-dependent aminotransferase family protein [Dactylosporangium sp. AC04546]